MQIWFVRVSLGIFLINSLLVSNNLPDSLFSTKELGALFACGFSALLAATASITRRQATPSLIFNNIDALTTAFLMILPGLQLLLSSHPLNIPAFTLTFSLGVGYFSIRVLTNGLEPRVLSNLLLEGITITASLHIIVSMLQKVTLIESYYPHVGVTSTFFNPGPYAIYSGVLVVLLLSNLKTSCPANLKQSLGYCIIISILIYFIAISLSRSAWIATTSAIVFLYSIYSNLKSEGLPTKQNILSIKGFFSLITIIVIISFLLFQLKKDSAIGRILIWRSSLEMTIDNWATGVGVGNFAAEYIKYQGTHLNDSLLEKERYETIAGDPHFAFNDILQITSERGVIGVGLFLLIIIYSFKYSLKCWRVNKIEHWAFGLYGGGLAAILLISVAGMTSYPLQIVSINILFWIIISFLVSSTNNISSLNILYSIKSIRSYRISAVILAISGLLITIRASTGTYSLLRLKEIHDCWPEKNHLLPNLFTFLDKDPRYLYTLAKHFMVTGELTKAIHVLQQAVELSPDKKLYYLLGECFERLGRIQESIRCYEIIERAMPILAKPKYHIALLYLKQGDYAKFNRKADEVINTSPRNKNNQVIQMQTDLLNRRKGLQYSAKK